MPTITQYIIFNLKTDDITEFRKAFGSYAKKYTLFHDHDNSETGKGKSISTYPLVQYRLDENLGNNYAAMLLINEAIDDFEKLTEENPFENFKLNGINYINNKKEFLKVKSKHKPEISTFKLLPKGKTFRYEIRDYIPLNKSKNNGEKNNLRIYQELPDMNSRLEYLELILRNHMVSLAAGLNIRISETISVKIIDIKNLTIKNLFYETPQFKIIIDCNLYIPNGIAIGNHKAYNCGVVNML